MFMFKIVPNEIGILVKSSQLWVGRRVGDSTL